MPHQAGMYYGGGNATKVNKRSQSLPYPFVSLYLRGRTDGFMLKGGDATKGELVRAVRMCSDAVRIAVAAAAAAAAAVHE